MSYASLMEEAQALEAKARSKEIEAEAAHAEEVELEGIKGWVGYVFDSSTVLTPAFSAFIRDVKRAFKESMVGYTMLSFTRGHFEFSAFFKNMKTQKLVYISCKDVRYWRDEWWTNLLIRTAKDSKDYTGGRNNYSAFTGIKSVVDRLTE